MKHMQYVGPREELRGHAALVREDPRSPGVVLVQFDFPVGQTRPADDWHDDHPECFGWHPFSPEEFLDPAEIPHGVAELTS